MKVLIYNIKGQPKYIPLLNGKYTLDYDINVEIMPPELYAKIENICEKYAKKLKRTIDKSMPVGFNSFKGKYKGCEIITIDKAQYIVKKNEVVK